MNRQEQLFGTRTRAECESLLADHARLCARMTPTNSVPDTARRAFEQANRNPPTVNRPAPAKVAPLPYDPIRAARAAWDAKGDDRSPATTETVVHGSSITITRDGQVIEHGGCVTYAPPE